MIDGLQVNIRTAYTFELDAVIGLMQAHADFEKASICTRGLRHRLIQAMRGAPPRLCLLVAEHKRELLGYCALTREFSSWRGCDYLHLDCLFIVTRARGLRVGKLFFGAVEQYAKQHGISHIEWQTPTWNRNAQRFYDSLGAMSSTKQRYVYLLPE